MRKFLLGLLVGLLLAVMTAVIGAFTLIRVGDRTPTVGRDATLIYKLEGDVPEVAPVELPFPFGPQQARVTVLDHYHLLRRAATDSRIKAVLFMPKGVDAGWGKLQEMRDALLAFKKSGKPLYAHLRSPGAAEYYLASACDRVTMGPQDVLNVKGLRAELLFVKRTLDKVGVELEFEYAGRYKNFGDQYLRTEPTPETREVVNSLLDGLYGHLLDVIAKSRRKSREEVAALLDRGPFLAEAAKSNGLLDDLRYEDEAYGELARKLGQRELTKLPHQSYLPSVADGLGGRNAKRVAVLVGEGAITRDEVGGPFDGNDGITSEGFRKVVQRVANDGTVDAVILRIDSPGGDAIASDELLRELKLLSRRKPTVVSMSDTAASGGYYMAITGDPIVAYPNTITGSIGVGFGRPNLKGLYDKLGFDTTLFQRGRNAAIDTVSRGLTPDERAKLREGVQDTYTTFVSLVAQARKRPYAQVEPLAQGRVWLGTQAKQNGLVDELGGIEKAVELVKAKAKIPAGETVRLVAYPPRRTFLEQLLQQSQPTVADTRLRALLKELQPFDLAVWATPGFKAVLPYRLTFR